MYINHGTGANGKSTFFDTIYTLLGGGYAGDIDIEALMERSKGGAASPEIMNLRGKRFVVAAESRQSDYLNESMIKKLTGDKYLTGRKLYQDVVTFERQFKLFLHVNHKPKVGTDPALWRRMHLIPWKKTITASERNPNLLKDLASELSGILNWCIEGYRLYKEEGLLPPPPIEEATKQYRHESNKVAQFLEDRCADYMAGSVGIRNDVYEDKNSLYQAFEIWCKENNVGTLSKKNFGEKMVELGFDPKSKVNPRSGKQIRVWRGVKIS